MIKKSKLGLYLQFLAVGVLFLLCCIAVYFDKNILAWTFGVLAVFCIPLVSLILYIIRKFKSQ